jgi:hypothetical protein
MLLHWSKVSLFIVKAVNSLELSLLLVIAQDYVFWFSFFTYYCIAQSVVEPRHGLEKNYLLA